MKDSVGVLVGIELLIVAFGGDIDLSIAYGQAGAIIGPGAGGNDEGKGPFIKFYHAPEASGYVKLSLPPYYDMVGGSIDEKGIVDVFFIDDADAVNAGSSYRFFCYVEVFPLPIQPTVHAPILIFLYVNGIGREGK
jgi:hypothetical protein